jgi:hypothetical protein
MSSTTKFDLMANEKYPFTEEMSVPDRRDQLKKRALYVERLQECQDRPAYHVLMPNGLEPSPCHCEPLMEDDTKGWQVVKKKIRVKRAKTHEELEEAANLDSWDDVIHYGRQTYTNVGQTFEHNGALFDIGSRF